MSTPVRDLAALPKGHLHLHLEAAITPALLHELEAATGVTVPLPESFDDFSDFSRTYRGLLAVLAPREHLARLIDETVAGQAAQGVVYVELGVSPQFYVETYGSLEAATEATIAMAAAAAERHGIGVGLMVTVDRMESPETAVELARVAAAYAGRGVTALGLANDERGYPAARFAEAFAIATAAGLLSTPHAGELEGPDSILEALDALGADRVLHGVRAVEDPALVARLAAEGVCLDVCPTSNVLLSVVTEIGAHPLPLLLAAGVRCSINADDPILFGPDVLAEYELCRTALGLTDEALAACALSSVECTAAPEELKAAARAGIAAWLAS